jgi:hypothetical protein
VSPDAYLMDKSEKMSVGEGNGRQFNRERV